MKKRRIRAALAPIDFDRDRSLPLNRAAHRACGLDVRPVLCKGCLDRLPQVGARYCIRVIVVVIDGSRAAQDAIFVGEENFGCAQP